VVNHHRVLCFFIYFFVKMVYNVNKRRRIV